jgi:hypothetical protein
LPVEGNFSTIFVGEHQRIPPQAALPQLRNRLPKGYDVFFFYDRNAAAAARTCEPAIIDRVGQGMIIGDFESKTPVARGPSAHNIGLDIGGFGGLVRR